MMQFRYTGYGVSRKPNWTSSPLQLYGQIFQSAFLQRTWRRALDRSYSPVTLFSNPACLKPIKTTGIRSKCNFSTSHQTYRSREEYNAARRWRYANDPEYRERCLAQDRQSYANNIDVYRTRNNARARERYLNDPAYRARRLAAVRARFANNPDLRARKSARERERYAKDPDYRARQNDRVPVYKQQLSDTKAAESETIDSKDCRQPITMESKSSNLNPTPSQDRTNYSGEHGNSKRDLHTSALVQHHGHRKELDTVVCPGNARKSLHTLAQNDRNGRIPRFHTERRLGLQTSARSARALSSTSQLARQSDEERRAKARAKYRWRCEHEEGFRESHNARVVEVRRHRQARDPEYNEHIREMFRRRYRMDTARRERSLESCSRSDARIEADPDRRAHEVRYQREFRGTDKYRQKRAAGALVKYHGTLGSLDRLEWVTHFPEALS